VICVPIDFLPQITPTTFFQITPTTFLQSAWLGAPGAGPGAAWPGAGPGAAQPVKRPGAACLVLGLV